MDTSPNNDARIPKHMLKIGAINHHASMLSIFTNWANNAGPTNNSTIGPRVDPASFTDLALIATAISTATTNIAKSKIVTTKRTHPTIDTEGGVKIPAARNLIATKRPTNCNSTDALAIIATANHLPHIRSERAMGVVNNASNVPLSRSPAVRSMDG